MSKKCIITISRQYGSGGRIVGKKLAELLKIPFYDKEIITMAAKESGYAEETFERAADAATHSLLYSLSMYGSGMGFSGLSLNDKVFLIQSEIIQKAALNSCVIVGRCADYVLRKEKNCIHFFIYSDIDSRVHRATTEYGLAEEKAKEVILKKDKRRASYYAYYTGEKWGQIDRYDLAINSDSIGVDETVAVLGQYVQAWKKR
ncbi:MAG TPA: cytidylate kinase-like family protein [Firmicutes bacterium]|nr:cytidylate kinase-like family protein [Bacillota bacterium]